MRIAALLASAVFFWGSAVHATVPFTYTHSGVGFHLGLNILDNSPNSQNVAFDVGGQGDIAFSLGPVGEAHYCPSVGVWMGGHEDYNLHTFVMEWYLNVGDARYYFPIAPTVKIRPYVGLGPMIAINYWRQHDDNAVPRLDDSYTDVSAGFNAFTGFDFRIAPSIILTAEMRAKMGDWDAFKFSGGMTFLVNGR